MELRNTNEARVYMQLKKEADHWEALNEKYPGNDIYFQMFMEHELKCSDYALEHEKEIWDDCGDNSISLG